jgi:hypothetical protein
MPGSSIKVFGDKDIAPKTRERPSIKGKEAVESDLAVESAEHENTPTSIAGKRAEADPQVAGKAAATKRSGSVIIAVRIIVSFLLPTVYGTETQAAAVRILCVWWENCIQCIQCYLQRPSSHATLQRLLLNLLVLITSTLLNRMIR